MELNQDNARTVVGGWWWWLVVGSWWLAHSDTTEAFSRQHSAGVILRPSGPKGSRVHHRDLPPLHAQMLL
jgi:hypothetical protein